MTDLTFDELIADTIRTLPKDFTFIEKVGAVMDCINSEFNLNPNQEAMTRITVREMLEAEEN